MTNLLYVIEGGPVGGAERVLLTTAGNIDKAQYRIEVCLLKPSAIMEEELKSLNVPVFILHMAGKWDIFSIFRLARFMRRRKIDIAHTSLYASNTFGRIAAILARVPVRIAWEHGEIFNKAARHRKIDRILSKFTDCILTCAQALKAEIIKKEGIPAHKIRVIYNCVDLNRFNISYDIQAVRRRLRIEPDENVIGSAGSLCEKKAQGYLIRAIPQIIRVFPRTKLLLAGEGPLKSDYIDMAKKLGISDRVIFAGFRTDIPEVISAIDLYVCSSIYNEGLPVSILEAMSLRKAVIATRVGGIPEVVIENQSSFLVPPKNADALARAVISLLADRDKMRRMGEAGFERVKEKFSPEEIVEEIEALYKEFLCKIRPKSR